MNRSGEGTSSRFPDRRAAGRELGVALRRVALADPVVVALPRGGVPVGFEVAEALDAPLEAMLVRKIGSPHDPELALGAVAADGQTILDHDTIKALGISRRELTTAVVAEQAELARRRKDYAGPPEAPLVDRTVLLVDDGVATGSTAVAAARALRGRGAATVILAVPVGPPGIDKALAGEFDDVICLCEPSMFGSVGRWYDDFTETGDEEVADLLAAAKLDYRDRPVRESTARIGAEGTEIEADLRVPPDPRGLVVFAHGSGSSRHSPRNRAVATKLNTSGFATLLVDLLTSDEMALQENVFDVEKLADRLAAATRWAASHPDVSGLPVGYVGASTGAAAALVAAADAGEGVSAVVCRGGRPDLAGARIRDVSAPTLMIVGGVDLRVLELNEIAASRMSAVHRVAVVPGASHLFVQPGALDRVAELAGEWFEEHLAGNGDRRRQQELSPH